MSDHPYGRRFSEEEVRLIKVMTDAGMRPMEVLKALKQKNPQLNSTRADLYNIKFRIRQGVLSEKFSRAWRPNRCSQVDTTPANETPNDNCLIINQNFVQGKFVESHGCLINVVNPATQGIVSKVPSSTFEELKVAVRAAKHAFPSWKRTPIAGRQRVMFKLRQLILRDMEKLAEKFGVEQGKMIKAARGDIFGGLEVVEYACGMTASQMGDFLPCVSNGIDARCTREPLGVCAGICLSDISSVYPLLMFPVAVTCGNTFILIPSQTSPGASMMLAALAAEAGLPDGVLNVVHGGSVSVQGFALFGSRDFRLRVEVRLPNVFVGKKKQDIVNHLCEDEDVKAVSLVGSKPACMELYALAAARGKLIQVDKRFKSHMIIMPDACTDAVLDGLVAAGLGYAGPWCMSLSTVIFVGQSMPWLIIVAYTIREEKLVQRAKALKVNGGTDSDADIGPVVSKETKDRLCSLVQSAVERGARLILDGRDIMVRNYAFAFEYGSKVPGYEKGNFIGPTIVGDVTTGMECYKQEDVVGPVLPCMQAGKLEDAIAIVNCNKCTSGAAIFTKSGCAARKFQNEVEAGLVGVNIPVPVPSLFLSTKESSCVGDLSFCGNASMQFYTQNKVVVQQWKDKHVNGSSSINPSLAESSRQGQIVPTSALSGSTQSGYVAPPSIPSTSGKDLLLGLDTRVTARNEIYLPPQGTTFGIPRSSQVNSAELVTSSCTTQNTEVFPSSGLTLGTSEASN
ncbi:Methylmalonate-semialdehyde dehydrogenase [acylating], mitochondrial-like protein [Drosera capensis]